MSPRYSNTATKMKKMRISAVTAAAATAVTVATLATLSAVVDLNTNSVEPVLDFSSVGPVSARRISLAMEGNPPSTNGSNSNNGSNQPSRQGQQAKSKKAAVAKPKGEQLKPFQHMNRVERMAIYGTYKKNTNSCS
jgi:hypothetical protein